MSGTFFALDSVTLKVDDKEVANYLYTDREVQALHRGGVQKLYLGNLKAGSHEIVAFFTGKGPHDRDYRRGTTLKVDKTVGAKYVELPHQRPRRFVAARVRRATVGVGRALASRFLTMRQRFSTAGFPMLHPLVLGAAAAWTARADEPAT